MKDSIGLVTIVFGGREHVKHSCAQSPLSAVRRSAFPVRLALPLTPSESSLLQRRSVITSSKHSKCSMSQQPGGRPDRESPRTIPRAYAIAINGPARSLWIPDPSTTRRLVRT